MIVKSVEAASPKVKREVRYQWLLKDRLMDAVCAARSQDHFHQLVEAEVFSDRRYAHIAKHRQIALEWYAMGAMHMQARMLGVEAPRAEQEPPAERPSTVRPKKTTKKKRPRKAAPKPKQPTKPPVPVETYGPRLWTTETILAPDYRSPFPPATDLEVSHG